jgi:hypothetical protein
MPSKYHTLPTKSGRKTGRGASVPTSSPDKHYTPPDVGAGRAAPPTQRPMGPMSPAAPSSGSGRAGQRP